MKNIKVVNKMEYSVEYELEQLHRQKAAIEQKIRKLTSLTSIHENVKLDVIKSKSPQCGKWTVYYKYRHIRWHGAMKINEPSEKWNPMFCCNTRKEAVENLAKAIEELQELYNDVSSQYEVEDF
jgi:hypothetical protein